MKRQNTLALRHRSWQRTERMVLLGAAAPVSTIPIIHQTVSEVPSQIALDTSSSCSDARGSVEITLRDDNTTPQAGSGSGAAGQRGSGTAD